MGYILKLEAAFPGVQDVMRSEPRPMNTPRKKPSPVRRIWRVTAEAPGGEFVDISLRRDAPRSQGLSGFSLKNVRGESFALPDVTLAPGASFRVWSRRTPGANEASWGRTTEAWEDVGDCAILVDPRGRILSVLPFGRGGGRCPEVGGR